MLLHHRRRHANAPQAPQLPCQALGALFCDGPHRSTMVLYSCSDLKMMGKKWICPSGFVCVSCAAHDDKVISCVGALRYPQTFSTAFCYALGSCDPCSRRVTRRKPGHQNA